MKYSIARDEPDSWVPIQTATAANEHTSLLPATNNTTLQALEPYQQTSETTTTTQNNSIHDTQSFITSALKKFRRSSFFSLIPSIILGSAIWFGTSPTDDLTVTSIHLLAVFLSCIFALITTSIDVPVIVLSALTLLSTTYSFQCIDHSTGISVECRLCGTEDPTTNGLVQCNAGKESFHSALEGFSSSVVWLIFAAFHLGKAVEVTRLGKRISLVLIQSFGKKIIGLAYAILLSELLLAPFVPSNTARGGGIVLPIVQSIATTLGSSPSSDPKVGGFLMLVGAHANILSASVYLTGMAANPIILSEANARYPELKFNFMTWIKGSSVPSLVCAAVLPLILAWSCGLFSDKSRDEEEAQQMKPDGDNIAQHAQKELAEMGSMSAKELQLCFVLLGCLVLWVTSGYTNMDSTQVAFIGIAVLLQMETISWKDIAHNTSAWETLFWLGGFVTIAGQLSSSGASAFLGRKISSGITNSKLPVLPALGIVYFLTTFMFSSLSAHTVAFGATFLDAGKSLGANPIILTCLLAYFGALGGCMTNFSSGSSAMYFAPGYVSRSKWFIIGGQMALLYLTVYFTIGMAWFSLLGWNS